MMLLPFGHAQKGLNRHQNGRQEDHATDRKCNVRIALRLFHYVPEADLTSQGGKETNGDTNDCIVRDEQTKHNKRRGSREGGK